MSMSATGRSLDELKALASSVLSLQNSPLREKFIELARKNKRETAYGLAGEIAINHGRSFKEAEALAKATGWLVVLRLKCEQMGRNDLFESVIRQEE